MSKRFHGNRRGSLPLDWRGPGTARLRVGCPPQSGPATCLSRVSTPRTSELITLDAELSEPAWEGAARLTGFSQYQPVDQRPAVEPTEIRVLYSAQAIYFAIIATASDPGSVRATLSKRDNISNDDRVTIYLDTFNDRRRAFFFGANPLGVQLTACVPKGRRAPATCLAGASTSILISGSRPRGA